MTFKTSAMVSMLALTAGWSTAQAAEFEDFARVVNVTPRVEQVNNPRRECYTTEVQTQQAAPRSAGGAILGGIAGGLLGSQVGNGNGKVAAAAVGAVAGALTGDRLDNQNNQPTVQTTPVQQCRMTDHWESRTSGYSVTYEYQGRSYTTVLPYDPGTRLRLQVSLTPRI
jgi:uncharacterized protein YcfJ